MQRYKKGSEMKSVLAMVALLLAINLNASAQQAEVAEKSPDTGLSFEATLDLYSAYVFRGCVVNDRPVWQPAGTVSYATGEYGTFSAGVWANFDITARNGCRSGGGLNEIDYTLSYAIDVDDFALEAGHLWYTFPKVNGHDYLFSTREVYGSAAYNNDIVTPSLAVYYDYAAAEGFYGVAALNKEIAMSDQLTLGVDLSLGAGDDDYMNAYFGESGFGLADLMLGVYALFAVTDNVAFGARLAWTSLVDSGARDNKIYWQEDILWGGLNLSAAF